MKHVVREATSHKTTFSNIKAKLKHWWIISKLFQEANLAQLLQQMTLTNF